MLNKKELLTYATSLISFGTLDIGLTYLLNPEFLILTITLIPLAIIPAHHFLLYQKNKEEKLVLTQNKLEQIKKEKFYNFLNKTERMKETFKVKQLCFFLTNHKDKLSSKDLIILERIMFIYLPNIIDSYILISEEEKAKEKLIFSLKEIEERLTEIKNNLSEEATHAFNKQTNLSNFVMNKVY